MTPAPIAAPKAATEKPRRRPEQTSYFKSPWLWGPPAGVAAVGVLVASRRSRPRAREPSVLAAAPASLGKMRNRAVMLTRDKVNELSAPHWVCDSSETRRDLGWTPAVQWPEGTRRAVEWYRSNGWL